MIVFMVTLFRMRVPSHWVTAYECNCANCQFFSGLDCLIFATSQPFNVNGPEVITPLNTLRILARDSGKTTAIHCRCHGRYLIVITTIGWLNSVISLAGYAIRFKNVFECISPFGDLGVGTDVSCSGLQVSLLLGLEARINPSLQRRLYV